NRTNVPHPPQRPIPPWTSSTNWIQEHTANQNTNPEAHPRINLRFQEDSRAHAISRGANATGASQVKLTFGKIRTSSTPDSRDKARFTLDLPPCPPYKSCAPEVR